MADSEGKGRCFKDALWTALRTVSGHKYTRLQDFARTISKLFQRVILPDSHRGDPGAWIQTPISACSPAFPLFLFYERPLVQRQNITETLHHDHQCCCVQATAKTRLNKS